MNATQWINSSAVGMNGIAPWPPVQNATAYTATTADWPGVEWLVDSLRP